LEREQVNLAAIMFTDIVGYTSLTESDEPLALKLLEDHRHVVRPLVSAHNGREVKTIGDAFLIEFASAAEATRCAVEIQGALEESNSRLEPEERILLRIGIHLGDIIHSGGDVYGDAVNVASRIEKLAEPGGVCVSRQVYDSVRGKLRDVQFESVGARQVRNVESVLEVFRIVLPHAARGASPLYAVRPGEEPQPRNKIAILPFVNIGPDSSDEYFADGLTEELISKLSQAKDLRVVARTSAMSYKNERQKKARDIGRELGAGTIVEGSVRKSGAKVRVTVQVVNAVNEEHLWAETYDRNLDDIFAIQSDIAARVAESFTSNLAPLLREAGQEETNDVTAYTYYLRGRYLFHGESEASVNQALEFFNKAIEEDPNFARAYVGRAECLLALEMFGTVPWVETSERAEADVRRALELDPDLPEAHAMLSQVKYTLDEFAEAEQEARRALELNPSLADAYLALGRLKWVTGHLAECTGLLETAYKLDPLKDENIWMLAEVYMEQRREADALELWSAADRLYPQLTYSTLCVYYALKRDFARADEFLEKFKLAAGGESTTFIRVDEAFIAAYKGDGVKARELIRQIEETSSPDRSLATPLGMIYYALGDLDKFFEYMNRAMDIHALSLGVLVNSPIYAEARRDPRMAALLGRLDLKIDLPA
jgi:adenylate cyclase